jgi:hypothetical protein
MFSILVETMNVINFSNKIISILTGEVRKSKKSIKKA